MSHHHPRLLIERFDHLAASLGGHCAQSFLGDGDPLGVSIDLSFAELAASARRRSNALVRLGIGPSDRIAFAAPPSQHAYPTLIAGIVTAALATMNYFLEVEALIRLIRVSGATTLLTAARFDDDPAAAEKFQRVHRALPGLRHVTFGGPAPENALDLEPLAAEEPGDVWHTRARDPSGERIAAIFHTGGTTGLPKLVPHTEAMIGAALDACGPAQGNRPGEIMLAGLPLFHTSGVLQTGLVPLSNGTRIILPSPRGFRDPNIIRNYWRLIERFQVTISALVPTMLAALTATAVESDVSSLKLILCGAAPLSPAMIRAVNKIATGAEVVEGWGMTETCGFSVMNPHGRTRIGAVGLPFPGVEIEIRETRAEGEPGRRCEADQLGELVVRGDTVITGYLDPRPELFTRDGWLRTGDLGRIDKDGYLWIAGRLKDVIIRGGHNIDPTLIEEPAYDHPAVQLAAAVGRPDKYAGELPILFVQLKPGAEVSAAELEAHVRERVLERAAAPKAVHILAEMPLSGPGKISKLRLRRDAAQAVFQQELDQLGGGLTAAATDDDRLGTVIMIATADGMAPDPTIVAAVSTTLDGYAIAHRWRETGSPI